MPIDWSGIERAFSDVTQQERGVPTQRENIVAQAMEELKRRQALAAAGLTEAQAAALPQQQELQRRVQEATIGARNAQAESARSLATQRTTPEDDWEITPDGRHLFNPRTQEIKPVPEGVGALVKPPTTRSGDNTSWITEYDPATGQNIRRKVASGTAFTPPPPVGVLQKKGQMGAAMDIVGDLNDPDTITSLAMELNAGNDGVIDRVMGSILSLAGQAGYTGTIGGKSAQSANVYNSQMRGMASILAKSFGESGRLSDQDIERTVQMFPVLGEPEPVTERKIARIKSLIRAIAHSPEGSAEQNSLLVDQVAMDLGGMDTGRGVVEPGGGVMAPGATADPLEGRTATGPNGEKIIRKGGRWVPIQ